MKEKPIIFSSEMAKAILDGRKTQTRRIIKPQPYECHNCDLIYNDHLIGSSIDCRSGKYINYEEIQGVCPFGYIGDRLWVRETFSWPCKHCSVHYKATEPDFVEKSYSADGKWTPAIYMPRSASRITLEITSIRVERLKDISRCDAAAEGACLPGPYYPNWYQRSRWPEENFKSLWESINGPGSWDLNPWVWVIEFTRLEES